MHTYPTLSSLLGQHPFFALFFQVSRKVWTVAVRFRKVLLEVIRVMLKVTVFRAHKWRSAW
jgi:hypothetical protein